VRLHEHGFDLLRQCPPGGILLHGPQENRRPIASLLPEPPDIALFLFAGFDVRPLTDSTIAMWASGVPSRVSRQFTNTRDKDRKTPRPLVIQIEMRANCPRTAHFLVTETGYLHQLLCRIGQFVG